MTNIAAPAPRQLSSPPSASTAPPASVRPQRQRKLEPRAIKNQAPRLIVNAVEGFGKTTLGAFAPDPVILTRQRGLRIWWDASAAFFEGDSECVELADAFFTM